MSFVCALSPLLRLLPSVFFFLFAFALSDFVCIITLHENLRTSWLCVWFSLKRALLQPLRAHRPPETLEKSVGKICAWPSNALKRPRRRMGAYKRGGGCGGQEARAAPGISGSKERKKESREEKMRGTRLISKTED